MPPSERSESRNLVESVSQKTPTIDLVVEVSAETFNSELEV